MVNIKVISHLFTLLAAHELVAPCDFYGDGKDVYELDHLMDLTRMFHESKGIVLNLPDEALTATDERSDRHLVQYGRIGAAQVPEKAWTWCGLTEGANEITIDMTSSYLVVGVATQGHGSSTVTWTTEYSVETSENGNDWVKHGRFTGNFDSETICERRLK